MINVVLSRWEWMSARRSKLAQRRKAQGFSQERFAELLGVHETTVRRWELGEWSPAVWRRQRVAQLLDVRLEELDGLLADAGGDQPAEDEVSQGDRAAAVAGWRRLAVSACGGELGALLEFSVDFWHVLVRGDNLLGPGHVLPSVLGQLAVLREWLGRTRGSDWCAVAAVAARYAESAAWLYEDMDDQVSARRWVQRAQQWAQRARESGMLAWIDYRRSQQALALGDTARALDCVRGAARAVSPGSPMSAAVAVQQAQVHAARGEARACWSLLDAARDRASKDLWGDARDGHGSFCSQEYVELHRAWCRVVLGLPGQAVVLFDQYVDGLPPVYRRDRGLTLARFARASWDAGDVRGAAVRAQQAWVVAAEVGSQRTVRQVRALGGLMREHQRVREVAGFLRQIRDGS